MGIAIFRKLSLRSFLLHYNTFCTKNQDGYSICNIIVLCRKWFPWKKGKSKRSEPLDRMEKLFYNLNGIFYRGGDYMKRVKVRVGVGDRYDKKYMDGRFDISVPVLSGESEEAIREAEKLRFEKLNDIACIMHKNYTTYTVKELDAVFELYHVSSLKELIKLQLGDFYYDMMVMLTAEEILCADRCHRI